MSKTFQAYYVLVDEVITKEYFIRSAHSADDARKQVEHSNFVLTEVEVIYKKLRRPIGLSIAIPSSKYQR